MRAFITEIVSDFPPPASLNEIQSNSFAMNSTTGNCGAGGLYACGAIGIRPRAPNHSWRPPFGQRKAYRGPIVRKALRAGIASAGDQERRHESSDGARTHCSP